jgi:diphthine-ammonia ligase
MKCVDHGHELICLANLHPAEESIDEINSYMYQSAAHNVIPALAQCFGVPLIRKAILGQTIIQSLDYERSVDDEVEDLYELLKSCKVKNKLHYTAVYC